MGGRLVAYLFPLLGAALVVAVGMAFVLFPFFANPGGPLGAHSPVPTTSSRSPSPAHAVRPSPAPTPTLPPPASPTPPGVSAASALTPVRLVIPAAQVNSAVETVGLDPQGVIGVPSQPMDAAWYNGSPEPGQPGNAIIDGHLDWWTGPGVFGHLSQVQTGDEIQITQADGSNVTFTVTGEQVFSANAQMPASMLTKSGPATVSLITCTGSWDAGQSEYLQRLVVNGSLS